MHFLENLRINIQESLFIYNITSLNLLMIAVAHKMGDDKIIMVSMLNHALSIEVPLPFYNCKQT